MYGPRQDPASPYSGVISIFARKVQERAPIAVHGDGQQTRDFVYVSDVVAHLVAAMRHLSLDRVGPTPCAQVANVCTGRETSVLALARTLGELSDHVPTIVHGTIHVLPQGYAWQSPMLKQAVAKADELVKAGKIDAARATAQRHEARKALLERRDAGHPDAGAPERRAQPPLFARPGRSW